MRNGYRVIDVDSHVTPSFEVLYRYAGQAIKDRWDEFKPYVREMNSPAAFVTVLRYSSWTCSVAKSMRTA